MHPATWRTIFLVAVGLVVLWLGYLARAVVTPLLLALVLAYILDPVVRLLERRGMSRGFASATVVIVALSALVTGVAVAVSQFAREANVFYDGVAGEPAAALGADGRVVEADRADFEARLPQGGEAASRLRQTKWEGRDFVYHDRNGDGAYQPGYAALALAKIHEALRDSRYAAPLGRALDGISQVGPELASAANSFLTGLVQGGKALASGVLGIVTLTILFPIYLFYSLVNLSRVYDVSVRHLPEGQRSRIVDILHKIHVTISAFFRGRLITMLVKGLMLLALYAAFGVPFSYVCAAFGAIASLVPVVGGIAGAVPPIVLALPSASGGQLAGLAIGMMVIEVVEGYVLVPALIGRRVGLHPLTVLVCTLIAGDLLGFFGMIVAVPLTAIVKILAAEFVLPEVRRRAGLPPLTADAALPPGDAPK